MNVLPQNPQETTSTVRVRFSQQLQQGASSQQGLFSAPTKEGTPPEPLKSILKQAFSLSPGYKPSERPSYLLPHPRTPMDHPEFLTSPIHTILCSTDARTSEALSAHDMLDAYTTLLVRLRSSINALSAPAGKLRALDALRASASILAAALCRDIARANAVPQNIEKTLALGWRFGLSDCQRRFAVESISVCHLAIQLSSLIFRLPTISSCFPVDALGCLLDAILDLASLPQLYMPSSAKIFTHVVWILSTQQLPQPLVSSRADRITSVVKRAVSGEPCEDGKAMVTMADGYFAIRNLIMWCPAAYSVPFAREILPIILSHLMSPSVEVREHATTALAGFALATLDSPSPFPTVRSQVHTFLEKQLSRHNNQPLASRLPALLEHATAPAPEPARAVVWALALAGSLVTLIGAHIFDSPRILHMLAKTLQRAMTGPDGYRRDQGRVAALQAGVWRCTVSAFARLRARPVSKSRENAAQLEETAFRLVKEELDGGVGRALIAVLLLPSRGDLPDSSPADVGRALCVIQDMVHSKIPTIHAEGRAILVHLLSGIGAIPAAATAGVSRYEPWNCDAVVPRALLSAGLWDVVGDGAIHVELPHMEWVRLLEEAEIAADWAVLVKSWTACALRELRKSKKHHLSSDLVQSWQALLLAQTHLTQGCGHLTASPAFACDAIAAAAAFLNATARADSRTPGPSSTPAEPSSSQTRRLTVVYQLWRVMRNVFARPWLADAATALLAAVLERSLNARHEPVAGAWGTLITDLIVLGEARVQEVWRSDESRDRVLWTTVARRWPEATEESWSWQSAVEFAMLLRSAPTLLEEELQTWTLLVCCAARKAELETCTVIAVFDSALDHAVSAEHQFVLVPKLLDAFTQHHGLKKLDVAPERLLGAVNRCAFQLYALGNSHSEASLKLLRSVHGFSNLVPGRLIVSFLITMMPALHLWIQDQGSVFTHSDYNEAVMPLYEDALISLVATGPTFEHLDNLAPLLTAVFDHAEIPVPALGPQSFRRFCETVFKDAPPSPSTCPITLWNCLKAFAKATDNLLVGSFPSASDSELGSVAIIESDLPSSPQAAIWLSKDDWLSSPTPQPSPRRAMGSSPPTRAWRHRLHGQIEKGPHNNESHSRTSALTRLEQPLTDLENVPMIDDFDIPSSQPQSPDLAPGAWMTDSHPLVGDRRGPSHMMVRTPLKRRKLCEDSPQKRWKSTPVPQTSGKNGKSRARSDHHGAGRLPSLRSQDENLRRSKSPCDDDYSQWEETIQSREIDYIQTNLANLSRQGPTSSQAPVSSKGLRDVLSTHMKPNPITTSISADHSHLASPFQLVGARHRDGTGPDVSLSFPSAPLHSQERLTLTPAAPSSPEYLKSLQQAYEGVLAEDPSGLNLDHLERAVKMVGLLSGILQERLCQGQGRVRD